MGRKVATAKKSWISAEKFSKREAALYLAAYIDGEGCVYFRKAILANGKLHQARVVTITSTDKELADAVANCFGILGIHCSRLTRPAPHGRNKPRYIVEVRRGADMFRIRQLVPIQHGEKRRKLDEALETYRGLHCFGCGVLHDERTKGCVNCNKRHYFRAASQRHRDKITMARSGGEV